METDLSSARPRRSRKILWSVFIVFLLLAIAGTLFGVLVGIDRKIDITVLDYKIDEKHTEFGAWGYKAPLSANLLALNENFYDIKFEQFKLRLGHPLYNGEISSVTLNDVMLPKRSSGVIIPIDLMFQYLFAQDTNGYLQELILNCTSSPPKQLYMGIDVDINFDTFILDGVRQEQRSFYFDCVKGMDKLGAIQTVPDENTLDISDTIGSFFSGN